MHNTKRWMLATALSAAFLFAGTFAPTASADYPQVSNLKAFSQETNFMSLPGYLRYVNFLQEQEWITRAEAVHIVNQQSGKA